MSAAMRSLDGGNAKRGTAAPILSVVVCTHNRPDDIEHCLRALMEQRLPDMEIIVVDSASRPEARQRLLTFTAPHPDICVELVDTPGSSLARNCGIARARGVWIALLDDDATPDPDWAAQALTLLRSLPADVAIVGGYTYPLWPTPEPPPLPALWLRYLSLIEVEREGDCTDTPLFVGANMLFRRAPLVDHGGFSARFGRIGDVLLSGDESFAAQMLAQQGWRCWYSSRVRARHRVPADRLDPAWFRRRMFWEGVTQRRLDAALRHTPALWPMARALLYAPALAFLSLGEGPHSTRLARACWHLGVLRAILGK